MHHRPAGLPLAARISGALTRGLVRTWRSTRRSGGRLGLGMALSTAVTGFVLAVPVVSSGSPTSTMSVDTSSSSGARSAEETSPVVMGRDGAPAPTPAADTPVVPVAPEVGPPAAEVVPATPEEAASTPETVPETATETAPQTATDTPASSTAPSPTAAPTAAATSAAATASGAEAEVIALVNEVRADAGCDPVVHDEGLARVARAHSADMRERDFFDHTNLAGLDPFDRAEAAGQTNAQAENIAVGQPDAVAVMDEWMDSSGHRANILDCELRTLGVGVAQGEDGPWWTQLFGD